MTSIIDYLSWRGDLSFDSSPFCDVDALALSRLAYIPFDGVVSDKFYEQISFHDAADRVLSLCCGDAPTRAFRMEDDERLLRAMSESKRFGNLTLTGYINHFDKAEEKQFSATTIVLPARELFVAYRGTDGTLVGWKEDFNMGFEDEVPAQRDAVEYLASAAGAFPRYRLRVGGHSKGGNLAVYASAFCGAPIQKRILRVCNNDGPGFSATVIGKDGFARILSRVCTYLPQSSIIGMLLEHDEDFRIVRSVNSGIMQHDIYSWQIMGGDFLFTDALTNSSVLIDKTLKDWTADMSIVQREKLIDGVYAVFCAADAKTLRELGSGRNSIAILKSVHSMDDETRALISDAFSILKRSLKKNLPGFLDEYLPARSGGE